MSIQQIERNALGHFEYLPLEGGYSVARNRDHTLIRCGLGSSMFNIAYGALKGLNGEDLDAAITAVIKHFEGQPFAWWVPPSLKDESLTRALVHQGFVVEADEHAMLAMVAELPSMQRKSDLRIERVQTLQQLEDLIRVIEVYDTSVRPFYLGLPEDALLGDEQLFVGYTPEGEPICTAILFVNEKSAGIFGVITDECQRGKGYGTDMMIFLLERAASLGLDTVTLSASSDSGYRIYERLGFKRLGQFECFEWGG